MIMLKRRNIREAAIQFLYLADLEDGPEAADMEDAFWQMIQESSLKKLNLAKAKAILHVAQGRDGRVIKLNELTSAIQPEIATGSGTKDLIEALKELAAQEDKLSSHIEALRSFLQNKSDNPVPDQMIQDAMDVNHSLMQARSSWDETSSDHPDWAVKLEAINATIAHLTRSSQRFASIDDPESTIVDFAHLRTSSNMFSGTCRYYEGKRYKCDRKRYEKCPTGFNLLAPFWKPFPLKIPSKIHQKIDSEKTLKIIAKGSQNGAEIDAKTHQKSMLEMVSKKIREIIKNHVSLKSEIIEIHRKKNGF